MKKFLFLFILSLSCGQEQEQQNKLVTDDISEITNNINGSENNSSIEKTSNHSIGDVNMYQYSNDSISQLFEIGLFKKKELTFKFTQKNKLNNQNFSIQGTAKLSSGSEIDEDEAGLSYQVEEFVSEDNYGTIYIRIGKQPDRDKLRIIQVDYEGTNIIYDIGILRTDRISE